jgi:O-antigen/teichoic acid export membrane protein
LLRLPSNNLPLVFLTRAWAAGAQLFVGVIVARLASFEVAGLFYLLLTCIFACVAIGKYGYDESLIKTVAVQYEANAEQAIFDATHTALAISAIVSVVVVVAFSYILPLSSGEVFNKLKSGLPTNRYAPLVLHSRAAGSWEVH